MRDGLFRELVLILLDPTVDDAAVRAAVHEKVGVPEELENLPKSVEGLGREIAARLPKVELTDLLVEVDRLTGFSRFFTHAGGSEPRVADLRVHLYASILAQATNIGLVRRRMQLETLRFSLIKIGGRVRELMTKVRIHPASGHPGQHLWDALSLAFRGVHE